MENEERKVADIPYIAHEAALARQERTIKRLWVLCIISFLALVFSNIYWINYEMQFEDVVTNVSQETSSESGNAVIYGDHAGAVIYGDSKANNNSKETGS